MKSRQGLVALFTAWAFATLFVAVFFNGGGLSTHTPSLHRTPIAVWSHNNVRNVKLTKEVSNTPIQTMSAPAPTSTSVPTNEPSNEDFGDIPEEHLQLWQQVVQDPAKRQEVYDGYLATAQQLRLVGTASEDMLGAHLTIVSAFISRFSQIGPNSERLSFEKFCKELGMGVEKARTLMIAGTNIDELKKKYGENPDATMSEIADNFVELSKGNFFEAVLSNENATRTLNINMAAMKMKRQEPTKSVVDTNAYPSIPAETKKDLMALQDEKKKKFNNPRVREVMSVVDKAMRKKNQDLQNARVKVSYQKSRRKSDMLLIAEWLREYHEYCFEAICEKLNTEPLPLRLVKVCIALRDDDDAALDDESESIDLDAQVPSAPPSLEAITPVNIPSEEKASEAAPPPSNATSAATELPATEAPVMPPLGTELSDATPPVEMSIVDRDDATGIMTGVTSALGGLMTSVFGTSDREASVLTATTLDEGKKAYPAKNFSVGQRATFGGHNLVVKSRSDGVHFWRRL